VNGGYDGAQDSVHRFVKAWRDERARVPAHAYVPMSFAPGEAYQFDWSNETITLAGLPLTIKAAHMTCRTNVDRCHPYPRHVCLQYRGYDSALDERSVSTDASPCHQQRSESRSVFATGSQAVHRERPAVARQPAHCDTRSKLRKGLYRALLGGSVVVGVWNLNPLPLQGAGSGWIASHSARVAAVTRSCRPPERSFFMPCGSA
jgi:hypothetical protein